jgi:hypothetical protein
MKVQPGDGYIPANKAQGTVTIIRP